MKCRNCGATSNGLTCPVCGHKQLKKAECPVCFTTLYSNQEYCPNCGSPTIYRKKDDIKKITPDTIIHSQSSHNYHTRSESYNYKEDAYDYNEDYKKPDVMRFSSIFEPLKKKNNYQRFQSSIKTTKTRVVPKALIVLSIVLIVFIAATVIYVENASFADSISFFSNNTVDDGNVDLDHFVFDNNTTQGEYNHNIKNDGLSYVYNHQLYIADFEGIKVYQEDNSSQLLVDDNDCSYLYVNDRGVYYKNLDDEYCVYDVNGRTALLYDVNECYQLGSDIIYLDNASSLSIYNIDTGARSYLYNNVYGFTVDDVNRRILVFDGDYNAMMIDFNGQVLVDDFADVYFYYDDYFVNGYLYSTDFYDGIYCRDVVSGEKHAVLEGEYYDFTITYKDDKEIIYGKNDDDYLKVYYNDDGETFVNIHEDVEGFYGNGDKVVFYVYDEDYYRVFYVADIEGNYVRLQ